MANQEQLEIVREQLHELVEARDYAGAASLLEDIHGADQADLLEALNDEAREAVVAIMRPEQIAETLEFLEEGLRADLLADLPAKQLAPILNRLDEKIATDIVQELGPEQAKEVVPLLRWRESVQELLEYPPDTAGGRMSV